MDWPHKLFFAAFLVLAVAIDGARGDAMLSGTVFCDRCKDGLISLFDYPVYGVRVEVVCTDSNGQVTMKREEVTNLVGNYVMRFDGVPDLGSCRARVSGSDRGSMTDCGLPGGPAQSIRLVFRILDLEMYTVSSLLAQPSQVSSYCPGSANPVPGPVFPVPGPPYPIPGQANPYPIPGYSVPGPPSPTQANPYPVPGYSVPGPPSPTPRQDNPYPVPIPPSSYPRPGYSVPVPPTPIPSQDNPYPSPGYSVPTPPTPIPRQDNPYPNPNPGYSVPTPPTPIPRHDNPYPNPGYSVPVPPTPIHIPSQDNPFPTPGYSVPVSPTPIHVPSQDNPYPSHGYSAPAPPVPEQSDPYQSGPIHPVQGSPNPYPEQTNPAPKLPYPGPVNPVGGYLNPDQGHPNPVSGPTTPTPPFRLPPMPQLPPLPPLPRMPPLPSWQASACPHQNWSMPEYRCHWRAVNPETRVAEIFGRVAGKRYGTEMTLNQGLQGRGDPYRTLLREGITALLNSYHNPLFQYPTLGVVQHLNWALMGSPRQVLVTALGFMRANSGSGLVSCRFKPCNSKQ